MNSLTRIWNDWMADGTMSSGEGIDVSFEHSWPWPPSVALLGGLLVAALVYWIYLSPNSPASRRLRLTLATLRVGLIAVLIFMMYGWMLNRHRTDLPDLLLVVDRSASMALADEYQNEDLGALIRNRMERGGYTTFRRWDQARLLMLEERRGWIRRLQERYRLKLFLIGEGVEAIDVDPEDESWWQAVDAVEPDDDASRLGVALEQILTAQRGRPTAAAVVLSDGITTAGVPLSNAAELARRKAIPLYLVGLGDENPPRDVRISNLLVDDVVFRDDVVNFDFLVQQEGFDGETVQARLMDAETNEVLAERAVSLESGSQGVPVRLSFRPQQEGTQEFAVQVSDLPQEADRENNRVPKSVQVRDATIKVLYVQEYPSYEFRTLKHLLGRLVQSADGQKLIELTTVLQEADFDYVEQEDTAVRVFPVTKEALFQYDIVVFGDVNPTYLSRAVMQNLSEFVSERGGGVVFLAGPRYTPLAYRKTPLESLFPIELSTASTPADDRILDEGFRVALTPLGQESPFMQIGASVETSEAIWQRLPILYWYLSAPDLKPAARVLAVHPHARSAGGAPLPLVTMQFVGAGKVVFLAIDESYRWSQVQGSDLYHSRFWLQILRYLSRSKLISDQEPAEILTDRQRYVQGEDVRVMASFLDDRLAPSRDNGVRLVIESDDGRPRELTLARDSVERGDFFTTLSELSPGSHRLRWLAPVLDPLPAPVQFFVEPPASEQARQQMDVSELQTTAELSRGRFYRFPEAARLLRELPPGREVRVESLPSEPIWNAWWCVTLFVCIATTEWLLRKRAGME